MKVQRILIPQYVGSISLDDVFHCALLALLILLIIDIINTCHPLTVWHPAHSSAVFSSSCGCGCFVIYWRHVDVISVDVLHGLVRPFCAFREGHPGVTPHVHVHVHDTRTLQTRFRAELRVMEILIEERRFNRILILSMTWSKEIQVTALTRRDESGTGAGRRWRRGRIGLFFFFFL